MGLILEENRIGCDWEGGLDGVVGFDEWRAMFAVSERMVSWLPNVSPRPIRFDLKQDVVPHLHP